MFYKEILSIMRVGKCTEVLWCIIQITKLQHKYFNAAESEKARTNSKRDRGQWV